jgi:mannose-6-phosphate isomerase-like protein (cupin superfamily)
MTSAGIGVADWPDQIGDNETRSSHRRLVPCKTTTQTATVERCYTASEDAPSDLTPDEQVVVSFTLAHREDCETAGNWQLVRRTLELGSFGINIVDIPPREQIPEHDETGRDQEEVFYILSGNPTFVIDGEDHPARNGMFARIDPVHSRTVRNDGDRPASVLILSAPRSSGYEPMGWA